jgi:hypothetical protein
MAITAAARIVVVDFMILLPGFGHAPDARCVGLNAAKFDCRIARAWLTGIAGA